MGKKGQNTRLLSLLLGSCLSYCSLDDNAQSGLYQVALEDMKTFFDLIEKKGWKSIKEKRQDLISLAAIEFNGDNSYPLKSISKLVI
jgi:hypothetical protein